MSNPAGIIKAFIVIFIVGVLGFFLFPSVFEQIDLIDTTGWNAIAAGVKAIMPYAFIGGIFIAIIFVWANKDKG